MTLKWDHNWPGFAHNTSSWLRAHKSSPLWNCGHDTLWFVWHKDRSESTSNGKAFGMNRKVLGWNPLEWDIFCHKKLLSLKNIHSSLVKNKCCCHCTGSISNIYFFYHKWISSICFSSQPVLTKMRQKAHGLGSSNFKWHEVGGSGVPENLHPIGIIHVLPQKNGHVHPFVGQKLMLLPKHFEC